MLYPVWKLVITFVEDFDIASMLQRTQNHQWSGKITTSGVVQQLALNSNSCDNKKCHETFTMEKAEEGGW